LAAVPTVVRAERVEDQAVDRAEAAGHLEGIDEIRFSGDGDFDPIGTEGTDAGTEGEPAGAMMHELGETSGLEASYKDERRRASHDAAQSSATLKRPTTLTCASG
jgi:hypothetical protein